MHISYYRKRSAEERAKADLAPNQRRRQMHLEVAEMFEKRCAASKDLGLNDGAAEDGVEGNAGTGAL